VCTELANPVLDEVVCHYRCWWWQPRQTLLLFFSCCQIYWSF